MASITFVANTTLTAGTRSYGPAAVPVGLTKVTMTIDRTNMTSGTGALTMGWSLELSTDNQVTWKPWGAAETVGGVVKDITNATILSSSFIISLPGPAQTGWFVRGFVTCNQSIQTSVTATIL